MAAQSTSPADLRRLRLWRTWLLGVAGGGQGLQLVLAPDRALVQAAYRNLQGWGDVGWQLFGVVLVVVAVLLVSPLTRPAGHLLGAAAYSVLLVAIATRGYWPGLTLLACGLHLGEVAQLGRERARKAGR